MFSPHPYPASLKAHMKSNPLYTDMRLTELAEVKRGQPSWTIEEYTRNAGDKGKLTALDLQVSPLLSWVRGWQYRRSPQLGPGECTGREWFRPAQPCPLRLLGSPNSNPQIPTPHGVI